MFVSKEIDDKIDELLLKEPTPENLNAIGDLFLKKGDKKRAIDYFMRAAKNTAMPKKAIAIYKKILRVSPLDTEVYEALIDMLERSYNIPEAIKYLDLLSRLYKNKGETLKFTEMQRRILDLKHNWERTLPPKEIKRSRETESISFGVTELPRQDSEYIEKAVTIKKSAISIRMLIGIGAAFILAIIIISSLIFLLRDKGKRLREYQIQKRAGNYDVMISNVTEDFIKNLPPGVLRLEELKTTSFSFINIKAVEGCIPNSIIDNPYEHISCLNNNGEAVRSLSNPVTEVSKRIIYKYGICSKGNDAVFAELCMACPVSHSSGIKMERLISEPLIIFWDNR